MSFKSKSFSVLKSMVLDGSIPGSPLLKPTSELDIIIEDSKRNSFNFILPRSTWSEIIIALGRFTLARKVKLEKGRHSCDATKNGSLRWFSRKIDGGY
jgi:hypothetical protein